MKNLKIALVIIALVALIALVPLFCLKNAEFAGSDDAGSKMVEEVTGQEYKPWAEPVLTKIIGGELPKEVESLLFCVQTGIGVGIIAYCFGYLVARKKFSAAASLYKVGKAESAGSAGNADSRGNTNKEQSNKNQALT